MDAPRCGVCGKAEWRHICSGSGVSDRVRGGDRHAVDMLAPAVTHSVTHKAAVTHKRTNAARQKDYRAAHADEVKKRNRERMAAKRS